MGILAGTVTYRCYSCGELINGDAVLTPLGDAGELLPNTRAYHPDHSPQENTDGD